MASSAPITHQIYAQPRTQLGGRHSRRLRRQGKLPAVLYGYEQEPLHLQLDEYEFRREFHHISENSLINLQCDGNSYQVLVKDYSIDLLADRLLHIDFCSVVAGHTLKTHVPLHCVGTPVGAKMGGLIEHNINELLVECLPKNMPPSIEVDISLLRLGDSLHVRDLQLPANVNILTSIEQLVVHIAAPRGVSDDDEDVVADTTIE